MTHEEKRQNLKAINHYLAMIEKEPNKFIPSKLMMQAIFQLLYSLMNDIEPKS